MDITHASASSLYDCAEVIAECDIYPGYSVAILYSGGAYYFWSETGVSTEATKHASKDGADKTFRETVVTFLDDEEVTSIEEVRLGDSEVIETVEYAGRYYCRVRSRDHSESTEYTIEQDAIQQLRDDIAEHAKMSENLVTDETGLHWESLDATQWAVTYKSVEGWLAVWRIDGESDYVVCEDQDEARERLEALLERFASETGDKTPRTYAEQIAQQIDTALAVRAAGDSAQRRGTQQLCDALHDIQGIRDGLPVDVSTLAARMRVSPGDLMRWCPILDNGDDRF